MKNNKDLTIGAMFGAIYGILLFLVRYLLPSTDSIIYYFIPLPIAIYTYWRGFKNGFVLFAVISMLSFLITDPFRTLLLLMPNYLLGLIFGLLKGKKIPCTILITFVIATIINFLSIYAFELITGVSYLESTIIEMNFLKDFFSNVNGDFFSKIILISIIIVFTLDALVKTFLLNILLIFMLNRLNIFNKDNLKFKL